MGAVSVGGLPEARGETQTAHAKTDALQFFIALALGAG